MESAPEPRKSFWTTVPGILTALAAVITAVGGLTGVAIAQRTTTAPTTTTPTTSAAPVTTSTPPTTAAPTTTTTSSTSTTTTTTRPAVEATLRADPFSGNATCPVKVTFSGRISLLVGSGTVSYRFLRSDGASAPVQSVTFAGPGSKDVTTTWQLGAPGKRLTGWQQLEILSPVHLTSSQAAFDITCN